MLYISDVEECNMFSLFSKKKREPNKDKLFKDWKLLEDNLFNQTFSSSDDFILEPGKSSIMLTAPHAVKHTREGSLLFSETRSALICDYFNKYKDIACCYKTLNLPDDANYDNISDFKNKIVEYVCKNNVKLLLDIHIMSSKSNSNLIIGTNFGHNLVGMVDLLNSLVKSMYGLYMNIGLDKKYCASLPNTVSRYVN